MTKVLSISIAAYNIAEYLPSTLSMFEGMKNKELIEILVVNDGSKDQTAQIAREFETRLPGIVRLIDKDNGGWGSTVNSGIQNATGKYFKLLDGDDYYNILNLDKYVEFLSNCDSDMVLTPFLLFEDKTNKIFNVERFNDVFYRKDIFSPSELNTMYSMHETTFKTKMLKDFFPNISEHCFYTDIEYIVKGYLHVHTIQSYPSVIYMYRVAREGQSDSLTGRVKHYKDHLHVIHVLHSILSSNIDNSKVKELIKERFHGMIKRQNNIFLSMPACQKTKDELRGYDDWVKVNCPDLYESTSRTMRIVRASQYTLYYPISVLVRWYESRR